MTNREAFSRWGLAPALSSLEDIRRELKAESKRRSNDDDNTNTDDTTDLLLLLCVQLFAAGQVEDSLQIWHAKQGDFDAFCYIDGELLCGAGVKETRDFLQQIDSSEATEALEYIEAYDWDSFTPTSHLSTYRNRFLWLA